MVTIPKLQDLYNDIIADIEGQYMFNIPVFGKVVLIVIAAVQAAKLKLYYLAIANLQKNIYVDTAEPEAIGGTLERFGRVKLNRNPFPAVAGQYTVSVTGVASAVIEAQTVFQSDPSSLNPGNLYVLDNDYTMPGTTGSILLRALTTGTAGKLSIGDTLTATAPILNVNQSATVTAETIQPLDAETTEQYRTAALNAYRLEPQGGAANDYRLWAADVQGVANTYPYATSGESNEIDLFVESDIADSTDNKGTPSAMMLTQVQAMIEDPNTYLPITNSGRKPLGVFLINYYPVTIFNIAVNITGNFSWTTQQKQQITGAIIAAINTMRPFVAAADILADKNDILDSNGLIAIILAVAPGSSFGLVTIYVNGALVMNGTYTFLQGNIPYIGGSTPLVDTVSYN